MAKIIALILAIVTPHIYGMRCYVAETQPWHDCIIFCDYSTENLWMWEGIEDWEKMDNAILVMYDNGTEYITDDIIVKATYTR